MDCITCTSKREPVPYLVHEEALARAERESERHVKANVRLWIALLVMTVLFVGSNALWLYYESQFVDEVTEIDQEVDTGEGDAFVSGVGDINYGESKTESDEANPNP